MPIKKVSLKHYKKKHRIGMKLIFLFILIIRLQKILVIFAPPSIMNRQDLPPVMIRVNNFLTFFSRYLSSYIDLSLSFFSVFLSLFFHFSFHSVSKARLLSYWLTVIAWHLYQMVTQQYGREQLFVLFKAFDQSKNKYFFFL